MKVCFHYTILWFRLPDCLRIECGRELSLDAKEVTEQKQKFGRKNRSLVTYDGIWEGVMLYNYVYDYFR